MDGRLKGAGGVVVAVVVVVRVVIDLTGERVKG